MGFRKDRDENSWDQFGQLPYPSRHQVSLPRQLLLDPWSLRIHPFSKLSKHTRKQKTRNCVETFLPRFPGDLLIDFSSFHMENRYFGISNFPLGPQDGYSAPPGPKIFKPFLQPQRSTLVLLSSLQSIQCNVHTLCNSLCVSGGQVGYILWEVLLPLHTLLVMPSYSPSQNLFSLFRAV